MIPVGVYYHPLFLEHDTGSHPESGRRVAAARSRLEGSSLSLDWRIPGKAKRADILRVHSPDLHDRVKEIAEAGGGFMNMETIVSSASYDAAMTAAGAGIEAVGAAVDNGLRSFLLVRPPGHHATPTESLGFCLFNSLAIAAAHARAQLGVERVLVFDWDVHHGNGTQDIFYDDPGVVVMSMHLSPHFPGTGAVHEVGSGQGKGYTANIPLPRGAGEAAAVLVFRHILEPMILEYRPDVVLVSSGYDSLAGDILGGLTYIPDTYRWMAGRLSRLTESVGGVGPVCFLEGGYDPLASAEATEATIEGLGGAGSMPGASPSEGEEAAVEAAVKALSPYWRNVSLPG